MENSLLFGHFSYFLKKRSLLKGFDFFAYFEKKFFQQVKIFLISSQKGYFFQNKS